jgi:CelD/BcsL family acetyltransferase involved in cellulose biosynthesis
MRGRPQTDRPSRRTWDVALEPVSSLEEIRDEWSQLAAAGRNVFSTWEWASTWWRHFGEERPLLLRAGRSEEGRLVLLPLYLWSERLVRCARFLGHGPADQLGPVCRDADRPLAAQALRRVVSEDSLDLLFAELLPRGVGWSAGLGLEPRRRESSPVVSLSDGWDGYLQTRSANMRQQIRRRERRLADRYRVHFRLADDPVRLPDDLALLFSLHRARWGRRTSAFTRWERFHLDFAATALERGWLRLWMLELDGRSVAAWYGFRYAGVESYYQAGRDPRRSDESVGFVLLAHSIKEAAMDGIREYRLLRGGEQFKLRFATADPGLATFLIARGTKGAIADHVSGAALRSERLRSLVRAVRRSGSSG